MILVTASVSVAEYEENRRKSAGGAAAVCVVQGTIRCGRCRKCRIDNEAGSLS